MDLTKRVVAYISSTLTQGLFYPNNKKFILHAYFDPDWSIYPTTRWAVTGFVTFLGDTLITWFSKNQNTISLSFVEVEYQAMEKNY